MCIVYECSCIFSFQKKTFLPLDFYVSSFCIRKGEISLALLLLLTLLPLLHRLNFLATYPGDGFANKMEFKGF